jgi:polar amino acid transport system substrate-binding protein
MKKIELTTLVTLLLPTMSFAENTDIDSIRWIGQSYPPYIYEDSSGAKRGEVIDKLSAILKASGSKRGAQDIEMKTFSKMFIRGNNDKNTVFFPLVRLPAREKMFKWVCPLFEDKPVVFARAGVNIASENDLKNYKISSKDGYHGAGQLDDMGISVKSFDSEQDAASALESSKVDMMVCDEQVCSQLLPKNKYQMAYRLKPAQMCFAFNKDTDDALVKLVQDGLK